MTDQKIRTLGLYQPFATLMLYGKVETRWVSTGKKPPFPLGRYLIYSTIQCYDYFEALGMMTDDQSEDAQDCFRKELQVSGGTIDPVSKDFITGHAICIGDLIDIIDPILPSTPKTFVKYIEPCSRRRVGLVFENMKRLKPFPIKGKQGIGFLSDEDRAKIQIV